MPRDADLEFLDPPVRPRHKDEVIIISDDEDIENWPPPTRARRTRPLSTDSSSSDSPVVLDEQDIRHRSRQHVPKRRKIENGHGAVPERTRKPPLTSDENDYTKVKVSFSPNGSRAKLAFQTGEAPPIPPQKTLLHDRNGFVGSIRDPFDPTAPAIAEDQCPWFYDHRYECKMYRGPGYERFPVVLGTVKGHKQICDKWEADKYEQHEEEALYIAGLTGGVNPFSLAKKQNTAKLEKQCLREVQAVFPQIQQKFVLEKYRARSTNTTDNDIAPSAIEIISEIAELDSYPKEEVVEVPEEVIVLPEDGTGVTITYKKDIPRDEAYLKEALRILAGEFSHIPTCSINRVLQEKQSLFDTFVYFNQTEANYFDAPRDQRPYCRSKQPRVFLEKKYQRGVCEPKDSKLYVNLVNEAQAVKQHDARELYRLKKDKDLEAAEESNLLQHRLEGSLIECQTCFDDEIPMNRAIMCEGDVGHFFCFRCVARLAESQIGAMKHEMMCMDGSGCKAILSIEGVGRAVPTKVVDKLAFYQQQAEISAAGIEGLEQCPHCEYKAICDPIEEDTVFLCQNPDCGKNTCRKCHETSHVPKTCDEAKKDKGLSARHFVEEARSEAMMRKCPKCKAKIIKELGCNKMVCSCGNMMCYVCQEDISGQSRDAGYQHFHKAGSKCPLYDAQGTERHDLDADAAEKEAIKKVKAQEGNEDLEDKELQIETGKAKSKKKKTAAARPPPVFPFNPYAGMANVVIPPLQNLHALLDDAGRNLQDAQALNRRTMLLAQVERQREELRVEQEQLRRQQEVMEAQRLERAVRDARNAARQAQDGVFRMMGGQGVGFPFIPYGGGYAQGQGQGLEMAGFANHHLYADFQPALLPQLPVQVPQLPLQLDEDEFGGFLFEGWAEEPGANPERWQGGGHGERNRIRNRNPNAAQEELDNLEFADYVLRGNRRRA
jgi:hypothetical protein